MNIIETNFNWNGGFTQRSSTSQIILHHADAITCTVEDIHRWHLNNGWTGIGYHYFVKKDGSIYRGRPENVVAWMGGQFGGEWIHAYIWLSP